MNTNELKDLNNSNFSDSPVASKQATESANLPSNDPIKINNRASGRGRNRNNTPVLTPTAYDYQNDRELAFQQGYASSNQSLGNVIATPYGDDYFDAKWMGISFGTTTDATRNPYSGINPLGNNVDFEHLRRNTQSTLGATVNTATQFVGKTLVNTVGGVVGGFYSLGSAIANLDSSKFYDNSVNRALDKATEWVDENNSVFTSQKANDENSLIGFNVETMKNLSDGFSFIAGAVLAEITTAGLASGAIALSAGTKLGRLGKLPLSLASKLNTEKASGLLPGLKSYGEAVKKAQDAIELVDDTSKLSRSLSQAQRAERLAEVLGDTSQTIENIKQASEALRNYSNLGRGLRTTVTGTFWEAGLEARQAKDEFKETNLRKAFEDIDNMSITEAEKENLKQAKEREIEELSNNAGLMTFGLNALVLKASNAIQFPSVFGAPSKLKPNQFANQFKKGIDGKFTLPKHVKATDVGRYLGAIVKNAATEGAEELSQGLISGTSQDYYKDILQSRTSDKVIHGQTASFLNSLGNTIESSVGEKDFWREGVIGAVMGAVGLPMLKRNKKGKLRPVWTGGMQEDIKQVNAYRQDRSLALTRLNELKNDLDDINGYNVDRAKRLELLNRRDDLAMLTGNDQEYEDNRQHKIYNLVTDAKNKGLDSYLQESLDEIQEMDLNEYEARFGYEKGTLTKEMMEADKKDTIDSFKRFSDAYDMVYKNLRMDDIKNSRVGTKMFDMLVHSVGFEQYLNKQLDLVKANIINSDFWKNLDYSEAEFEQVMQDTVEYKSAMENFNYRLDQAINKEYNRLQDDIKANEQVYNDNLNLLPDNIKQIFSEGFNTYNELLKAGKNVEAQNVLEALTSSLSTATTNLEDNTEINGKSVSQFANDLFKQKTDLYKKLNGLDKETIKKNIAKEGSPEYLEWKKTLNEEIDAINKQLKEKHEKDTKLMLDKGQAQKLTLSQVLGVVESNNRFQSASRKAAALARLNKPSLMNQIQKDSIDIHNELMKFEVMYAKKLSTVRMASQLLNTSPANAYRRTAMMEFDANMDMLRIQTYELQYSKANMDSEGLDTVVIDLAYVKTSLEKLNKDMKDLKDEFGITDKMLAEQQKFIDEVQTIVDSVESLLKGEDLKDQASDAAQRDLDKKSSEKTNDALNEDERLKAQFEANMNNPLQQGNVPGQQAQVQTAEQQQAMDEIPTADGVRPLFQTKPFYTIYPTDNANTVRPGFSTTPIGVKVKEGEIRYNQTATLNIPLEDELADDGLVQYLQNIGVSIEDYRQGREKVRNAVKSGNLNVVFGDFNSLDPQVKTYILNARIIFDIYDSKVKLRRGRQVADTSGNLVHSMYFYAPQQNSKETVDKARESLNKEIKDLNNAYEAKVLEIQDNNNLTAEDKQSEISKLSYKHDIATNNVMSKYDNIISDKNFYTNFELRRQAIVHSLNNANEALPLRIGGFLNGVIQPSSSIKTAELDLFNLSNDYTAENYNLDDTTNPLIDDLDNFNLDNLVYVTSEFKGREMRTFSDNSSVTLNDGSLVIKDYGNTGEVYFIHETKNGQKVPIKLNRNKLGYNPELVTEIAKIFESYLVNKNKEAKLPKSDNPLMSVFNNLTYAQFFELMFKPLMSNTNPVDVDSMNLISLDNDGNIRYGSQKLTKASDLDQGSNANVYNAVIKAISNARPVIHNKYISNKGSKQLNTIGKWFINNGFLTHTFTTGDSSSNVDKVFLRDPNKAVPFSIHMLNTDIDRQSNRTTGTRKKRDAIKNLFDKFGLFGDRITLTPKEQDRATVHDLIEELYLQTQALPEGAELSEDDVVGIIQNVFNNKMLQILELIKTYPEVATHSKIKNVFNKYQSFNDVDMNDVWLYIKDSNNTLDLYLKNYIKYLHIIKQGENRLNKLRGYYKKYKTALDGRVIPVNQVDQNETDTLVTKEIYDKFVNTGEVPQSVLNNLANKIKNNENLTAQEIAIFSDKTFEINKILEDEFAKVNEEAEIPMYIPDADTAKRYETLEDYRGEKVIFEGEEFYVQPDGEGSPRLVLINANRIIEPTQEQIDSLELAKTPYQLMQERYKVNEVTNDHIYINGTKYTFNLDENGNIINLTNDAGQVISNESIVIFSEIERNKLEYNKPVTQEEIEVIEEIVEENPHAKALLEGVFGLNMNDRVDSALDKLYDNKELSEQEKLSVYLWLEEAFVNLNKLRTARDAQEYKDAEDTLTIIAHLLYENKEIFDKTYEEYTEQPSPEETKGERTNQKQQEVNSKLSSNQTTTSSQAQEGVSQNNVQVITLPIKQKDGSFKDNIYTVNPNEGTIINSKGKPIKSNSPVGKRVLALVNWEVDNPDDVENTNSELENITEGSSIDGNKLLSEMDDLVAQNGGQVVPEVNGKNIANPTDFVEQTPEDDAVLTTLGVELNKAPVKESDMTPKELSDKEAAISSDFNEALDKINAKVKSDNRSNEVERSKKAEEGGTDIDNSSKSHDSDETEYDPNERNYEPDDFESQANDPNVQVFTDFNAIFGTAVADVSENEVDEFNNSESKKIDENNINISKDMENVNFVINSKLASFTITNVKGVVFKTKVNSIVKEINNRNLNFDISVKENYINFASNIYNSVVDKNTNDNDKKTVMSELVKFGNNLGISNITPNEINCNF